jgi:hypothetical protein
LRVPKVHSFIKKLINNNKIISNALFLKLTKVIFENLRVSSESKHEKQNLGDNLTVVNLYKKNRMSATLEFRFVTAINSTLLHCGVGLKIIRTK